MCSSQHQVSSWQSVHQVMTSISAQNVVCIFLSACKLGYYIMQLLEDNNNGTPGTGRLQRPCFCCCLAWHQTALCTHIALKAPACSNVAMVCLEPLQYGADKQKACCVCLCRVFQQHVWLLHGNGSPRFWLGNFGAGPIRNTLVGLSAVVGSMQQYHCSPDVRQAQQEWPWTCLQVITTLPLSLSFLSLLVQPASGQLDLTCVFG